MLGKRVNIAPSSGEYQYAIVGVREGSSASSALCSMNIHRPRFIRGEVNGNARRDMADPIYILAYLFSGAPEMKCEDAADVNDDGV